MKYRLNLDLWREGGGLSGKEESSHKSLELELLMAWWHQLHLHTYHLQSNLKYIFSYDKTMSIRTF